MVGHSEICSAAFKKWKWFDGFDFCQEKYILKIIYMKTFERNNGGYVVSQIQILPIYIFNFESFKLEFFSGWREREREGERVWEWNERKREIERERGAKENEREEKREKTPASYPHSDITFNTFEHWNRTKPSKFATQK